MSVEHLKHHIQIYDKLITLDIYAGDYFDIFGSWVALVILGKFSFSEKILELID